MSAAPHLFTFTGNLLAERTLEFAAWSAGKTQRAASESFQVGGKGINVSKMLNRLHVANTALCFTGGAPGAECESWLRARGFFFHAFASDRPTRIGLVVRAPGQPETTFLGPDVPPSRDAVARCAQFLDALPDGQLLAICGSIPGWEDATFDPLRAALERWLRRGHLAADTYGPPLQWLATHPLALVKINASEFRTLGIDGDTFPAALDAARRTLPVRAWIVTDGPGPIWFADTEHAPANLEPPRIREVSATGSGDVLFACVLHQRFVLKATLHEALLAALPAAAANAAHPGVAEFP